MLLIFAPRQNYGGDNTEIQLHSKVYDIILPTEKKKIIKKTKILWFLLLDHVFRAIRKSLI